jgi:hypothetical protein
MNRKNSYTSYYVCSRQLRKKENRVGWWEEKEKSIANE